MPPANEPEPTNTMRLMTIEVEDAHLGAAPVALATFDEAE